MVVVMLVAGACSDTSEPVTAGTAATVPPDSAATEPGTESPDEEIVLASGSFEIPAVDGIQDAPGFHEVIGRAGRIVDAAGMAGDVLVFRLRDLTRTDIECSSEHPLSGCVTIDWSDFEERPRVPPGGAFSHRVTVELVSGPHDFFLSDTGALADVPDPYRPG